MRRVGERGRDVEEGVSHTLYGIKAEKINKENTPTNKLLIFVFTSKEPPYVCLCWHCHGAVSCKLQKKKREI